MATSSIRRYPATCPDCGRDRLVVTRKQIGKICSGCRYARQYRHGLSTTRIGKIYGNMKARCGHYAGKGPPNAKHYRDRGIVICQEWLEDRKTFFAWSFANGYRDDLEIDRINNDGPYSPDNCRWITHQQNNANRPPVRSAAKLTVDDVRAIRLRRANGETLKAIADDYGVKFQSISKIVSFQQWKDV